MAEKTKKQFYTEDERIRRVWDIEDIKDCFSVVLPADLSYVFFVLLK